MRNNKGRSIASVIIIILILILIAFLFYEIVYIDIFDIMGKDNTMLADGKHCRYIEYTCK